MGCSAGYSSPPQLLPSHAVGSGVGSGIGLGVGSDVGTGVGSGVDSEVSKGVGKGVLEGLGLVVGYSSPNQLSLYQPGLEVGS